MFCTEVIWKCLLLSKLVNSKKMGKCETGPVRSIWGGEYDRNGLWRHFYFSFSTVFFNRVSSILIYPCCYLFIIIFICGKKAVIEFRWLEGSFYALEWMVLDKYKYKTVTVFIILGLNFLLQREAMKEGLLTPRSLWQISEV